MKYHEAESQKHCFGDGNCKIETSPEEAASSEKRREYNSAWVSLAGWWGRTRFLAAWWPPVLTGGTLWHLFLRTETNSLEIGRNLSTDWNKLWIRPGVQRRNPKENNVWKQIHCEVTLDEKSTETTPLIFPFTELFKNRVPSFARKFHLKEVSKTTTTQQQSDCHSRDVSLWHRFENT